MTKFITTLLFAVLAALGVYMARRRILFALKTGAIVYVVLLFARLLLSLGSIADRLDELIWPALFLFLVWTILWWISIAYAERRDRVRVRERRLRRASGAGRGAR